MIIIVYVAMSFSIGTFLGFLIREQIIMNSYQKYNQELKK